MRRGAFIVLRNSNWVDYLSFDGATVSRAGFGDTRAVDLNGRTPLHCACVSATLPAIKYLIYHGSDPTDADNFGKVLFVFAVYACLFLSFRVMLNGLVADATATA